MQRAGQTLPCQAPSRPSCLPTRPSLNRRCNIRILFESLDPATQTSVDERFERIRQTKINQGIYTGETESLLQVLTNHRDDFEKWRYLHEKIGVGLNTHPTVLNSVIEAALEEYLSRSG